LDACRGIGDGVLPGGLALGQNLKAETKNKTAGRTAQWLSWIIFTKTVPLCEAVFLYLNITKAMVI
jgi:hypothetical protein